MAVQPSKKPKLVHPPFTIPEVEKNLSLDKVTDLLLAFQKQNEIFFGRQIVFAQKAIKSFSDCEDDKKAILVFLKTIYFKNSPKSFDSLFQEEVQNAFSSRNFDALRPLFEIGVNAASQFEVFGKRASLFEHALDSLAPIDFIRSLTAPPFDLAIPFENGETPLHHFIQHIGGNMIPRPNGYEAQAVDMLYHSSLNKKGKPLLTYAYHFLSRIKRSRPLELIVQRLLERAGYPFPQNGAGGKEKWMYPCPVTTIIEALAHPDPEGGYRPLTLPAPVPKYLMKEEVDEITLFQGMDVEIVDKEPLGLKQILRKEAAVCQVLLGKIENQETPIRWESEGVKHHILKSVRQLLTRPSGRALVYDVVRSEIPMFVVSSKDRNGTTCVAEEQRFPLLISCDFDNSVPVICMERGRLIKEETPPFLTLAHEWMHYLLYANSKKLFDELFCQRVPHWNNRNEQLVITGVKGEDIVCENMLFNEFGFCRRINAD